MLRPPVVVVSGRSIADTWERAVLEVWSAGLEVPTEYGEKAREASLLMTVEDPFAEPRVHRGDVVAVMGTKSYVEEVLDGTLDCHVQEGKLPYTYHERLYSYRIGETVLDQIEEVRRKLQLTPYTRRAQAITWQPAKDLFMDSPPCLQRLWIKIYDRSLVLQTEWRSRDLFRAAHINMLALTELQRSLSRELDCGVGSYLDFSNSAHIYERSYSDVERFLATLRKRKSEAGLLQNVQVKAFVL